MLCSLSEYTGCGQPKHYMLKVGQAKVTMHTRLSFSLKGAYALPVLAHITVQTPLTMTYVF